MAQGSAHINANSTFSWWGAMLSNNTIQVIAPEIWFLDRKTPSTLLPSDWMLI